MADVVGFGNYGIGWTMERKTYMFYMLIWLIAPQEFLYVL